MILVQLIMIKKPNKLYGSLFSNETNFMDNFSQNRNKNLQKSKNFLFNKSSSNTSSELLSKADEAQKTQIFFVIVLIVSGRLDTNV